MELRQANKASSGPVVVFLPGIIMPAELRYEPLVRELGNGIQAFTKELEVYAPTVSDKKYMLDAEVEALVRAADMRAIDRFYLYGHSAGGAIAIGFAAVHPGRLLGLGLDEPASDFSEETRAVWAKQLDPINALPTDERMQAFMRAQVASSVQLPPAPAGEPPAWMASRPAGIDAFTAAMNVHVLKASPSAFGGPVYYSFGSQTNPVWQEMRARLASVFPNFTSEEYDGLHHLNTSHVAEPARVAAALRRVWSI
jgi:pimeloyl-ACP methyl ester carboxylesterase